MVKISNPRFKCWECGKRVRTAQGLKTHGTRLCHQIEEPRPPQRTARKSGVMPGEDRADKGLNKPPRRKVARKSGVMPGEDAGRSKSGERRVTTGKASSEERSQSRAERPTGKADSSEETSSSSSSPSSDARSQSRDERPTGAEDEDTGAFKCDVCDEVFASQRALGTHFRSHPVQSNIARLERVLPQDQEQDSEDSEDSEDDQVDQNLQEELRQWQQDFFNVLS